MTKHRRGDPYEVGYGKPPKEHQFKKGQSSSRRSGRKAELRHPLRELEEVLFEKRTVSLNGVDTELTLFDLLLHSVKQKAASGDLRASKLVNRYMSKIAARTPGPSADYSESIRKFLDRIDEQSPRDPGAPDDAGDGNER